MWGGWTLTVIAQEGLSKSFSAEALAQLGRYRWPGNVRELRNVVQRAYVMAGGPVIDAGWLPTPEVGALTDVDMAAVAPITPSATSSVAPATMPLQVPVPATNAAPPPVASGMPTAGPGAPAVVLPIGVSMARAERALILATLLHFHHHKERTAATLGVSLKTLYNRLKEYAADGDTVADPPLA